MRVLVTGASGVFGSEVARRLVRHGVDVVGLSRRTPVVAGVEHVAGDIRDAEAVRRAMAGCDAVAHLAWTVTALHDPGETRAVNVGGTQNVLDAMDATSCGRIVFSSSVTAYGAWPDNPAALRETDPLRPDPTFLYGAHKAEAEALVAASGVQYVITRTASVAGRHVDNVGLRLFGGPVVTAIKGEAARWQFVHQDDVGRFHADAVLSDRTGVVNVAADDVLSLDEVARLIGRRVVELPESVVTRMTDLGWRYHLTELDPGALAGMRYMPVADTTRLHDDWGFESRVDRCGGARRHGAHPLAGRLPRGAPRRPRHPPAVGRHPGRRRRSTRARRRARARRAPGCRGRARRPRRPGVSDPHRGEPVGGVPRADDAAHAHRRVAASCTPRPTARSRSSAWKATSRRTSGPAPPRSSATASGRTCRCCAAWRR